MCASPAYRVKKIFRPSTYNPQTFAHDLTFIILAEPIKFSSKVKKIPVNFHASKVKGKFSKCILDDGLFSVILNPPIANVLLHLHSLKKQESKFDKANKADKAIRLLKLLRLRRL